MEFDIYRSEEPLGGRGERKGGGGHYIKEVGVAELSETSLDIIICNCSL